MKHYNKIYNIPNGKSERSYVSYETNQREEKHLFDLGYKYYINRYMYPFGKYLLVKILDPIPSNPDTLVVCSSSINFRYVVHFKDLVLNDKPYLSPE